MPETPIRLSPASGWAKHALARQKMRPLDLTPFLRSDEELVEIIDFAITERPSGPAGWNDYTHEFLGSNSEFVPNPPQDVPTLDDPAIEDGHVLVWLRSAATKQEQTRTAYSCIIIVETSLGQHLPFDQRLTVSQTGRARG